MCSCASIIIRKCLELKKQIWTQFANKEVGSLFLRGHLIAPVFPISRTIILFAGTTCRAAVNLCPCQLVCVICMLMYYILVTILFDNVGVHLNHACKTLVVGRFWGRHTGSTTGHLVVLQCQIQWRGNNQALATTLFSQALSQIMYHVLFVQCYINIVVKTKDVSSPSLLPTQVIKVALKLVCSCFHLLSFQCFGSRGMALLEKAIRNNVSQSSSHSGDRHLTSVWFGMCRYVDTVESLADKRAFSFIVFSSSRSDCREVRSWTTPAPGECRFSMWMVSFSLTDASSVFLVWCVVGLC